MPVAVKPLFRPETLARKLESEWPAQDLVANPLANRPST
jgi:hypothetical protein